MGTVRVGMARLWLGWWPLPADEDMAPARALGFVRPAGGRAAATAAGPGRFRHLRRTEGRAPLAPRWPPLAPSSRSSAPAAALSAAAAAAAARFSDLRHQPREQQQRQQRRRRQPEVGEGGSPEESRESGSTGSGVPGRGLLWSGAGLNPGWPEDPCEWDGQGGLGKSCVCVVCVWVCVCLSACVCLCVFVCVSVCFN